MAVGKRTRFEIFKRDSFTCMYCGRTPPVVTLEVDHIYPSSKGGTDEYDNLLTACFECNRGKRDGTLEYIPIAGVSVQEKLQAQQERAEQLREFNDFQLSLRKEYERMAIVVSDRWLILVGDDPDKFTLPESRMASLRMFVERLPIVEILDAVDIAFEKTHASKTYDINTWKYFCGICWNKIKRANGEGASHEA